MKRPVRAEDGYYHMDGKKFKELIGSSRKQVWNETAYKTPGGLTKKNLVLNKRGRIVSKVKYELSKKEHKQNKRLFKTYTAKPGKFGAVKKNTRKKRKNSSTRKNN